MGLIERLFGLVFGGGRNAVRETVEIFRENAEAGAQRDASARAAILQQYGAEFATPQKGAFDRFMDGLNRLPRPMLALGTLGLFVAAMVDPLWFAERMQGIALVPEPLWWLLGVIVSFYFGARHQAKAQDFQRALAGTVGHLPVVMRNIETVRDLRRATAPVPEVGQAALVSEEAHGGETLAPEAGDPDANPALEEWRRSRAA